MLDSKKKDRSIWSGDEVNNIENVAIYNIIIMIQTIWWAFGSHYFEGESCAYVLSTMETYVESVSSCNIETKVLQLYKMSKYTRR